MSAHGPTGPAPVLLSDPRIATIEWGADDEPLVDLRGTAVRVDGRLADEEGAFAHLRQDVVRRLLVAQQALPAGFALLVVEGYRPPALQRRYFDEYVGRLRAEHPQLDAAALREQASAYISSPEVAPHGTGGAVDLTLVSTGGVELELGTAVNASPLDTDGACCTDSPGVPAAARQLRNVLGSALSGAGLVNYPTEWWHWSYGERYWALHLGLATTRYGPVAWR